MTTRNRILSEDPVTVWGPRSSARQATAIDAQATWPQVTSQVVLDVVEHPLWNPCAFMPIYVLRDT